MNVTIPPMQARREGEPVADLTDYYVVHRAMTADVPRLAAVLADWADGSRRPTRQGALALRRYLDGVVSEIPNHHEVEDAVMWPVIETVAGDAAGRVAGLAGLTEDHHRLDALLDEATGLVDDLPLLVTDRDAAGRLAAVLREMAALLLEHIEAEERDVFPLIARYVRVPDYKWAQRQFQRNLAPRQLPFVAGWVLSHATEAELAHLRSAAVPPLRPLLGLFHRRFAALHRQVFDPDVASTTGHPR
jgi:iron-sulfur cluster repair protein YtfE (RIC family)